VSAPSPAAKRVPSPSRSGRPGWRACAGTRSVLQERR
jgi:hypothetical protein